MKILSLRNILGAGAVYGAVQYAKKNGGFQKAFEGLVSKARDTINMKKDELIGKAHDASVDVEPASTGYGSRSFDGGGYSSDFGGNGSRRS